MSKPLTQEEKFNQFVTTQRIVHNRVFSNEKQAKQEFDKVQRDIARYKKGLDIKVELKKTQICTECKEELELEFFHYSTKYKLGVKKKCKSCCNKSRRYLLPHEKQEKLRETKKRIEVMLKQGTSREAIIGTLDISLSFYYETRNFKGWEK